MLNGNSMEVKQLFILHLSPQSSLLRFLNFLLSYKLCFHWLKTKSGDLKLRSALQSLLNFKEMDKVWHI